MLRRCIALIALISTSSCGGAGVNTLPQPNAHTAASAHTTTTLTISVPHATTTTALRRATYISTATQSIRVDVKPHLSATSVSGFPITANLTAGSAGCTSTLTATLCDVSLSLGPGNFDMTVTTYDGTGGSGNLLSAAHSMPLLVSEGQANVVPLALGGVPVSVRVVATNGSINGEPALGFTIGFATSAVVSAYGVDADGNTIVGTGAPAISATSDAGALSVTPPAATAPNAIAVSSAGATTIGHITVTVTPVAGTGTSAVTRTFTVQTPNYPRIYVSDYSYGIHVYDATGYALSPPGGFPGASSAGGITYDSANGLLYVTSEVVGNSSILAYDQSGNPQSVGTVTGISTLLNGITYDSANAKLYLSGLGSTYDASGNSTTSPAMASGANAAYDPLNNEIYSGNAAYTASGSIVTSSFPGAAQIEGFAYNAADGYVYIASVYPTGVTAYDASNSQHVLSGSFTLHSGSDQIFGIGADPSSGNVYLAINTHYLAGFDQNGNALGAPWNEVSSGLGDPTGVVVVPSR